MTYQIESTMLGKGTYGSVFKAINTTTNEVVAVKIASKADKESVAQIRQEYKMLMLCDHANVIKCKDYCETEINVYMVLEYCSGDNLLNFLLGKGKIEEKTVLTIFK